MTDYERRATFLQALAHPARLRILEVLADHPACVCDLTWRLGRRQPYISQQLMVLRAAGLVTGDREGANIRYRLTDPRLSRLLET
jgi:ArsR family transcriptional regulator